MASPSGPAAPRYPYGSFAPTPPPPIPPPPVPGPVPTAGAGKPVFGILSLALGVLAASSFLLFEFLEGVAFLLGLGMGVAAIVLGAIGISRAGKLNVPSERGLSIAGLVIGIIVVVGSILLIIVVLILFAACAQAFACEGASRVGTNPRPRDLRSWLGGLLAHHPECPRYREDVFRVAGARLCVGCFTATPVFAVAWGGLALLAPWPWAFWGWMAAGTVLCLPHVGSALGWATTRGQKIATKTLLGLGSAITLHGLLESPLAEAEKIAVLFGLTALLAVSAALRAQRMERACRDHVHGEPLPQA